jgi:hypothetical protein
VKRSLAAANAIRAGNSSRRAISRIMNSHSPCAQREVQGEVQGEVQASGEPIGEK